MEFSNTNLKAAISRNFPFNKSIPSLNTTAIVGAGRKANEERKSQRNSGESNKDFIKSRKSECVIEQYYQTEETAVEEAALEEMFSTINIASGSRYPEKYLTKCAVHLPSNVSTFYASGALECKIKCSNI